MRIFGYDNDVRTYVMPVYSHDFASLSDLVFGRTLAKPQQQQDLPQIPIAS